jgi:hypothetical protein
MTVFGNRAEEFMRGLGVRATAFEAYYEFGIMSAAFDCVSEAVASVALCEWRVGNEFLCGSLLSKKGRRTTNH